MDTYYKYMKVRDIPDKYPFTKAQIRVWLLTRQANGLYKCIRKVGKNLYIREDLFMKWIETHAEKALLKVKNVK
jgi:hypothetical protein